MTKQVLDVQQMQHLQELGLELKETMLYWARCVDNNPRAATHYGKWILIKGNNAQTVGLMHWEFIPAYTLQDVLDELPASIKHKDFRYYLVYNKSEGFIGYYGVDFAGNHRYARYEELYDGIDGLSVIDAAYSMLCWAIENKFVDTNKEKCCGSCRWFCNEDIYGGGWCAIKRGERTCAEICGKWEGIP